MSSVNVYFGGNFAIWGTDGAVQFEIDGRLYRYTDDLSKVFISGDTVIGMAGNMSLFHQVKHEFIQCPVKTPEVLQEIARRLSISYPVPPKSDDSDVYGVADILLGRFENGQFALYHLCHDNGFSISRRTAKPGGTSFVSMGIRTKEVNEKFLELLKNYGNQPDEQQIIKTFMQTYNHVSSQEIGGMMRLYLQIPEYMGVMHECLIREVPGVKRFPQDCHVPLEKIQAMGQICDIHCIMADAIIASDICALSSDDGYTKLVSGGVKVMDSSGVVKAHLGQYESGKFGLKATDGYIEGAKSKWDLGTGTFRLGNSDSDFRMKFDGTDLTFSDDVRIQFKGDTGPQGPQGPQGNPGSYYAPGWVGATAINFNSIQSPSGAFNKLALGQTDAASIILQGGKSDETTRSAIYGGGKSSYNSATAGFWMGDDDGDWKFDIGNDTNYLRWDGSKLDIAGRLGVHTETEMETVEVGAYLSGSKLSGKTTNGARTYYEIGTARTSLAASRGGILRCKTYLDGDDTDDCYMDITHNVIQAFKKPFAIQAGHKILLTTNTLTTSHFATTFGSSVNIDGNLSIGADYKTIAAPADGAIVKGAVGIGVTSVTSGQKLEVNGSIKATGFNTSGNAGVSGTFTDKNDKTVTVTNGIITGIA